MSAFIVQRQNKVPEVGDIVQIIGRTIDSLNEPLDLDLLYKDLGAGWTPFSVREGHQKISTFMQRPRWMAPDKFPSIWAMPGVRGAKVSA